MGTSDDLEVVTSRRQFRRPAVHAHATVIAGLVAAVVMALAGCGKDQAATELSGYTRTPVPDVAKVELPKADGSGALPAVAQKGGYRIVYFGYTSCPDVCPTTLSDLKRAIKQLPADEQKKVDVAMMTIDPDRDLPDRITEYLANFFPKNGRALRASDPADLSKVAGAFGASYSVTPGKDGTPEVTHTGDLYVVDDRGKVVLQWPFGVGAGSMGSDLVTLFAQQKSAPAQ